MPPGTTVELTYARAGKEHATAPMTPVEAAGWFNPDRGFLFEPMMFLCKGDSIGEALALGGQETLDDVTLGLPHRKGAGHEQGLAARSGGPLDDLLDSPLCRRPGHHAADVVPHPAEHNLAVINFLPIPVLDGGHMMFLLYEGIRGKPADERVQMVLSYLGLALILALMVWVLGLDFHLISRHVPPPR